MILTLPPEEEEIEVQQLLATKDTNGKVNHVDVEDLFDDDEIDIVEEKRNNNSSLFGSAKKSPLGTIAKKSTTKGEMKINLKDIPKKPMMTTARKSTGRVARLSEFVTRFFEKSPKSGNKLH